MRHLDLTRFRPPWQASRTCSRRPRREPATGAYPAERMDEPPAGLVSCAGTRTGPAGGDPARLAPAARAAIAAACGVPARNNPAGVSCRIASGTARICCPALRARSGGPVATVVLAGRWRAASRTRAQQTAGSLPALLLGP